jgi:uncharacterized membrane protein YkvA (DUF1232 family)
MRYEQLTGLMSETGLSPEKLSTRLGISNLTYRRWLKRPPQEDIPKGYERNIAGGVYQLLAEGKLNHDSRDVSNFLENNLPEFFQAAISQFHVPSDMFNKNSTHQDKVAAILSHIGKNAKLRRKVDSSTVKIKKFSTWGSAWKGRIVLLMKVIRSKQLTLMDKLVAYGALFYLILPFDLIPDSIPVFGYVDDFGILGFAVAYYAKRFPELFPKDSPAKSKGGK